MVVRSSELIFLALLLAINDEISAAIHCSGSLPRDDRGLQVRIGPLW